MIGEDEGIRPASLDRSEGDLLLYDYFKHLTSLSILALGGVLAVSQAADPSDVKPTMVIIVLVMLALSGALAFGGTNEIVHGRMTGKAIEKSINVYRLGAPSLLAMGVGMFLYMFSDSLS